MHYKWSHFNKTKVVFYPKVGIRRMEIITRPVLNNEGRVVASELAYCHRSVTLLYMLLLMGGLTPGLSALKHI